MKPIRFLPLLVVSAACLCFHTSLRGAAGAGDFHTWAATPPMGWNSWDCFGTTVTEAQIKAQADFMSAKLKAHGWEYIVVDIQWYEPSSKGHDYRPDARLSMDAFSRLTPAVEKFPSTANGQGFKPLADYVHSKGLKFGFHMMRGIPRQAVKQNTPIKGTSARAADIANTNSTCAWNPDMYGVDVTRPGGQEYYDSIFEMAAAWGADFVKVDDISRPYDAMQQGEIEAIRKAIDKTGRPIVLSLSPGETPLSKGEHVSSHVNMWRISDDFWDNWPLLVSQFKRLHDWTPYRRPGAWPDADMLPLGKVRFGQPSKFTRDEQFTLMTLWAIARSPLIHGGDMTLTDDFTLALLTNDEVLRVNQHSENNRQLFRTDEGLIAWVADAVGSGDKYLAVFNTRQQPGPAASSNSVNLITRNLPAAESDPTAAPVPVRLADLGISGDVTVRDLWNGNDLGVLGREFAPRIRSHGAALYRLHQATGTGAVTNAARQAPGSMNWTTQQDHRNMMEQLGISRLRPGPSGQVGLTNSANYDPVKANPYPNLPDPLVLRNGQKVTRGEIWWKQRRPEIVEDFEREVIGRVPRPAPQVTWRVATQFVDRVVGDFPVVAKQLVGHADNTACPEITVDIQMTLVTPAKAKGVVPVLMMYGGFFGSSLPRRPGEPEPKGFGGFGGGNFADPPSDEQLIRAGWGYAILNPYSVQPDNGAGLRKGIIGLANKGQPRKPDDWGALRAWAWAASRGLDYLGTDSSVDARRVGIEGVSRFGKAALVAMAFEPRFAVVLVGSSGEGGAKLHRRNFGEAVENLTGSGEYHWMAGNFLKYGAAEAAFGSKNASDLPVDAHELIALCAPRPTFISYGIPEKGDANWLDQQGSYMATVAAGPVFRLLGARDIGEKDDYRVAQMPPVNTGLLDGELAWRQHDGGHEDRSNMKYFIAWANRLLKHRPPEAAELK